MSVWSTQLFPDICANDNAVDCPTIGQINNCKMVSNWLKCGEISSRKLTRFETGLIHKIEFSAEDNCIELMLAPSYV